MIDVDLTGMGRNLDKRRFDPSATVPGFDIPLDEMRSALRDLYARAGGRRSRAGLLTDPLRPRRGVAYWVFAFLVAVTGIVLGVLTADMDLDGLQGWAYFPLLGAAGAFYLALRGVVCFRPRAETLLALDGRAPVIYLRSFRDDDAMVGRPMRLSLDAFRWNYILTEYTRGGVFRVMFHHGKVRLEQAIEDELSGIGPFIAIGEPKESHPDFGATRAYFEGDDVAWRSAVQSWIGRAAVVVVVPGQTHGLAWELEQIQAGGSTTKLLMVFPPESAKRRAARLTALAGMIADPRWHEAVTSPANNPLLAVFSTGAGELVRVTSRTPKLAELEFAVELGLYGMFCSPHECA